LLCVVGGGGGKGTFEMAFSIGVARIGRPSLMPCSALSLTLHKKKVTTTTTLRVGVGRGGGLTQGYHSIAENR